MSIRCPIHVRQNPACHICCAVARDEAEARALECLVALALRIDLGEGTQEEIAKYMTEPVKLSKEDEDALKRAHPKLLEALREELKADARLITARGKPLNTKLTDGSAITKDV